MMDVLERVYRILRAQIPPADGDVGWDEADPSHREFNYGTGSESQGASAAQDAAVDPGLARCYANLEIPYGSGLEEARRAWKRMLKKYHPDLHARDPEKRRVANQLTAELTKAYREIEGDLKNKKENY